MSEEPKPEPALKKAAVVQVPFAALAHALGLPEGVEVTACNVQFHKDCLLVRVQGELPIQYGLKPGLELKVREYVVGRVPTVEFKASV